MRCRICGGKMVEVPYETINTKARLFVCIDPGCSFCRVPRLLGEEDMTIALDVERFPRSMSEINAAIDAAIDDAAREEGS